jgi:hypothetical protein
MNSAAGVLLTMCAKIAALVLPVRRRTSPKIKPITNRITNLLGSK